MKTKVIYIPLYDYQATIFFKKTEEEIRDWFKENCDQQPPDEFFDSLCNTEAVARTAHQPPFSCVLFTVWNNSPYIKGITAHELFHLAEFHFNVIGLEHNEHTSEAWAYFIGELTRQFYET